MADVGITLVLKVLDFGAFRISDFWAREAVMDQIYQQAGYIVGALLS
jgi:hypothetical protein